MLVGRNERATGCYMVKNKVVQHKLQVKERQLRLCNKKVTDNPSILYSFRNPDMTKLKKSLLFSGVLQQLYK